MVSNILTKSVLMNLSVPISSIVTQLLISTQVVTITPTLSIYLSGPPEIFQSCLLANLYIRLRSTTRPDQNQSSVTRFIVHLILCVHSDHITGLIQLKFDHNCILLLCLFFIRVVVGWWNDWHESLKTKMKKFTTSELSVNDFYFSCSSQT